MSIQAVCAVGPGLVRLPSTRTTIGACEGGHLRRVRPLNAYRAVNGSQSPTSDHPMHGYRNFVQATRRCQALHFQ
jgi:hypothetical protein